MSNHNHTNTHDAHQFGLLQAREFVRPVALEELQGWLDRWRNSLTSEQVRLAEQLIALLDQPLLDC